VFPEIVGGFKMMKSNKNGKTLQLIGSGPVVDGRQLKALCAQNVYLSPLQRNIEMHLESDEMDEQEMDGACLECCAKCGEFMAIEVIEGHARKCVGKNSTVDIEKDASQQPDPEQLPAVLNANGIQKMITHRSKFVTATDEMAYADREQCGNFVTVLRASYIDDAIRLSKCPFFM
jgi:hypothetical protein